MCKFFWYNYSIWKIDNTPKIIQSENYQFEPVLFETIDLNWINRIEWLELNDQLQVNCVDNLDGAFAF